MFAGSGIIPYVGHHVEHPAICLIAIEGTRTCLSRRDKALHQRRQRLIEFGEAGLLQGPVVHLDIDVRMIVPVPGSRYSICPESLQIGRQAAGTGTADEQIASVVIVQSSQCRRLLLCEAEDALVRRERIIRRGRKRQGNTVVEETVGRKFSDILDEKDYIPDSYVFEVSSPGLGRPLKKEKDFKRSIGEEVEIRTYRAIDRQKEFTGILNVWKKVQIISTGKKNEKNIQTRQVISAEASECHFSPIRRVYGRSHWKLQVQE